MEASKKKREPVFEGDTDLFPLELASAAQPKDAVVIDESEGDESLCGVDELKMDFESASNSSSSLSLQTLSNWELRRREWTKGHLPYDPNPTLEAWRYRPSTSRLGM